MPDGGQTAVWRREIEEPSAWVPADLQADRSWEVALSPAEAGELLAALDRVNGQRLPLHRIDRDSFPLPGCADSLDRIRRQLRAGRGFALLRGFPVAGRSRADIARLYWGFCAHLGTGVSQNSDAGLIHNVTEGRLRPNQGTRGVGDPGPVSLHVDLADCVSLLCVRQAADSPPSLLASATTVHNALLARHPDILDRLYRGFVWDRQNEHDPAETPTTGYRVPVFSEADGMISCRYNRKWISKARWRGGDVFSAEETEAMDRFDALAREFGFAFDFRPGDVQFANNYTVLHGRAPHRPAASEAETRLLMRIWFNMAEIRRFADEPVIRHGVLRHGRLGWTAAEVAAGLEGRRHRRRAADQAPLG